MYSFMTQKFFIFQFEGLWVSHHNFGTFLLILITNETKEQAWKRNVVLVPIKHLQTTTYAPLFEKQDFAGITGNCK